MTTARKTSKKAVATTKSATRKPKSVKVDYYPNSMTFWVSAAAGSLIVLVAVMITYS